MHLPEVMGANSIIKGNDDERFQIGAEERKGKLEERPATMKSKAKEAVMGLLEVVGSVAASRVTARDSIAGQGRRGEGKRGFSFLK
ncbi:hypothetical protein COCNU_scaffold007924G000030 [Cocos nucifera]|nr:hypothetical protein [Cocos nucifera]